MALLFLYKVKMLYHLPGSSIIACAGKKPDMIWIVKNFQILLMRALIADSESLKVGLSPGGVNRFLLISLRPTTLT